MDKSRYFAKNNFEVSVFITITESFHKINGAKGFSNLNEWCKYYRRQIFGGDTYHEDDEVTFKVLSYRIIYELFNAFLILRLEHAISDNEISDFIIIYLKYSLWLDYEPLLDARKEYTGEFY
jgi:hypothetical protein